MKRVFWIVNSNGPGGAERCSHLLVDGFNLFTEVDVVLVCLYRGDFSDVFSSQRFFIIDRALRKGLYRYFDFVLIFFRFFKFFLSVRFDCRQDVLVSNLPFANFLAFGLFAKRHFVVLHSSFSRKGLSRLFRILFGFILRSSKVVCVSEGVRDDALSFFRLQAEDVFVNYNPISSDSIRCSSLKGSFEHVGPFIVHIGRFVPVKRHLLLLRAFSRIKDFIPHNLIFVGDGPTKTVVELEVEALGLGGRVVFLGYLGNPFPVLKRSDLLVLCSDHEGLPGVLLEAICLGIPVVSTDCISGPREILLPPFDKFLVSVGSQVELQEKILSSLADYPRYPIDFLDRFTLEVVVRRYLDLFKMGGQK